MTTRAEAISEAEDFFDGGGLFAELADRIAVPTESPNPDRASELYRYLADELVPVLDHLGFDVELLDPRGAVGALEDPADV